MNESIKRKEPRLPTKPRLLLIVNMINSDYGASRLVQRIK